MSEELKEIKMIMKEQGMKIRNEIEELKKYLKQGEDTYRNEKERKENREFGEDKIKKYQDKTRK